VFKKLLLGIALSACVAGCAQTPPQKVAQAKSSPPPGCVYPGTATRLPEPSSGCAGFGRSWSQQDLQRSGVGAFDVAQGLQQLDPTVTARH
jgi:hypothetical protein